MFHNTFYVDQSTWLELGNDAEEINLWVSIAWHIPYLFEGQIIARDWVCFIDLNIFIELVSSLYLCCLIKLNAKFIWDRSKFEVGHFYNSTFHSICGALLNHVVPMQGILAESRRHDSCSVFVDAIKIQHMATSSRVFIRPDRMFPVNFNMDRPVAWHRVQIRHRRIIILILIAFAIVKLLSFLGLWIIHIVHTDPFLVEVLDIISFFVLDS